MSKNIRGLISLTVSIFVIATLVTIVLGRESHSALIQPPPENQIYFPIVFKSAAFFVASNGSNSNPGSLERPWRTIQYAVNHSTPGSTVYIRGGTYQENVNIDHAGSQNNPKSLVNYGAEIVTIQGGSSPAISGFTTDWVVQGLTLTSTANRTLWLEGVERWQVINNTIIGAVYLDGSYNLFKGNTVDGNQHIGDQNGIMDNGYLRRSHHNQYISNTIYGFLIRGIWAANGSHDIIISGNHVFNILGNRGACIDLDSAVRVTYRNVVRGNNVHNCTLIGIELENSFDTLVENNYIYDPGREGVEVISYETCEVGGESGQYGSPTGNCQGVILNTTIRQNVIFNAGSTGSIVCYAAAGVKVTANTIYNGDSAAIFFKDDVNHCHHWELKGNIFSNHSRAEVSVYNSASISYDNYNLLYHPGANEAYQVFGTNARFYTLAGWRSLTGLAGQSIESNPLFVNPGISDFHLQSTSPGIDKGIDPGIATDFDGLPRLFGAGYDIGAFERQSK